MVAQGTTLAGRYRLDTRLGAGGMGEVWRGEDTVLARTVAVKVLLPGRTDDPGFVARFQGEARAMATINHPGVVDVYDYGVTQVAGAGATAYLVMKFVDGEALDRLLARLGRIAPEPAMELIAQAASALQAVHDQGIVHRDVKPGNLMVRSDGTLVLTDFGIARSDSASRLTDAGMVLGTAAYCAPEQAEGAPVTEMVDIYALGVVAYECLAGHRPFDGDTPVTIALKHIREDPPPLPADIPPAVRRLVGQALSKDPARRFPTAAAMSAASSAAALPGADGSAQPQVGTALPYPSTGAIAAAPQPVGPPVGGTDGVPSSGYPMTGDMQPASPPTEATPVGRHTEPVAEQHGGASGGRGRRRGSRKGGMIAMLAIGGAVLTAGGVGVVMANMAQGDDKIAIHLGDSTATTPTARPTRKPVQTFSPRPPRTRPAVRTTAPPSPTWSPEPSATPTPTSTPSSEPTASETVASPTPSVSREPQTKKLVPGVVGLTQEQALALIRKSGFKAKVVQVGLDEAPATGCTQVVHQSPGKGAMLEAEKNVNITVDMTVECLIGPSSAPTPNPKAP
ncbi:serine/threonine protein kinase [Sinosporangium album]|uniref:non-specific serine/threonine protein kinase n=1 Tax=Sinosporangium album TaxID=504805 RepID=A0A1G8HA54_9ACTN|nr:serine/threonine-protein kinase [Sinosporangium album]SDI03532.1 serine/threonine protein kinase [Sinosporangium album]